MAPEGVVGFSGLVPLSPPTPWKVGVAGDRLLFDPHERTRAALAVPTTVQDADVGWFNLRQPLGLDGRVGYFPGASLVLFLQLPLRTWPDFYPYFCGSCVFFLASLGKLVEYFPRKVDRQHTFPPRASLSWTLG